MSSVTAKDRLSMLPRRKRWFLLLNVVLVILCTALAVGLASLAGSFETITAAERFGGSSETRFAQIACYLPAGEEKSADDVVSLRQSLETKFVEQSLEASDGGSLYLDAYYTRARVTVTSDHASAEVNTFGVGGDFFYFHPLALRSGSYIAERDLMDDLVVLDEVLAWRLFGSTDLAGMSLTINGKPFVVSGVVSLEKDSVSQRAQTEEGTLFLSYSALARLKEGVSIDSYEIVMPDPISGYALGVIEELFSTEDGIFVENSGRFSLTRLAGLLGQFGERSMRIGAVACPYWENALRLAEDYAALLLVLIVLTALCPTLSLVVLTIRAVMMFSRFVRRDMPQRISAAVERRRETRYARSTAKDTEGE